ncbi:hypothetical protein AB0D87_21185 [Streptomyces sp. NPDC048342]|uniref:hypothetical protein n=1 Tax=unclassified Streptomyces TaxID=2593676 RepID=UPI0034166407
MRLHEKPSAPALRPVNGFHLSLVAIVPATDRRPRFGMSRDRAAFRVVELEDTGPPNSSAHGIVCVDALGRAADQAVAVRELGRVLAPAAGWF